MGQINVVPLLQKQLPGANIALQKSIYPLWTKTVKYIQTIFVSNGDKSFEKDKIKIMIKGNLNWRSDRGKRETLRYKDKDFLSFSGLQFQMSSFPRGIKMIIISTPQHLKISLTSPNDFCLLPRAQLLISAVHRLHY